jgi:hypothetical protein
LRVQGPCQAPSFWPDVPPAQLYWPDVPPGQNRSRQLFDRSEKLPEISGYIWRGPENTLENARHAAAIFGKVIV